MSVLARFDGSWCFLYDADRVYATLNSSCQVAYCILIVLTAINCGNLTDPANGQVTRTAGTTFGQTATYSCNTGYNLVGSINRTCQSTGVWSGSVPTCQGVLHVCM